MSSDGDSNMLTFDHRMVAAVVPLVRAIAAEKCRCHLLFCAFRGFMRVKSIFSVWIRSVRKKKAPCQTFIAQFLIGSIWQHVAARRLLRLNIHQSPDWLLFLTSAYNVFIPIALLYYHYHVRHNTVSIQWSAVRQIDSNRYHKLI